MHNKNNNKSHTFIQGLRPFSSSIPKTLKKHLKKGGYNYSNIIDNWTKMVTKKISDACYPIKIKMGKDMKNGILFLSGMVLVWLIGVLMKNINSLLGNNSCIFMKSLFIM